jgi:pSer/pThr/pTyr-binding forkhead associated (FHA) protein
MTTSGDSPRLIIYAENDTQYLQLSERSIWTFGRGKANTVKISDACSSRYHAQLEVVEGKFYYFVDLGSRNGSLVNDRLIMEPELLKNGDRISIGSTTMIFENNLEGSANQESTHPSHEVLMLHSSPSQEEFWQEILHSQGIGFFSATSDGEFSNQIDLQATSNTLPKVLLVDIRAYQGNPYYFCRWCRRKYPEVLIFLSDSSRQDISVFESQVAGKNGASALLAAIDRDDLHLDIAKILTQVNSILVALGRGNISNTELFAILRLLSNRPIPNASMTLVSLDS